MLVFYLQLVVAVNVWFVSFFLRFRQRVVQNRLRRRRRRRRRRRVLLGSRRSPNKYVSGNVVYFFSSPDEQYGDAGEEEEEMHVANFPTLRVTKSWPHFLLYFVPLHVRRARSTPPIRIHFLMSPNGISNKEALGSLLPPPLSLRPTSVPLPADYLLFSYLLFSYSTYSTSSSPASSSPTHCPTSR